MPDGPASEEGVDMKKPVWPPRDWRAMISLIFTIGGSVAASGFIVWLVLIVWKGGWSAAMESERLRILSIALFGALGIITIDRISLGFAINRRRISGTFAGASFEASGGDDEELPSPPVVTTTTTTAVSPAAPPVAPDDQQFEEGKP
jgi:hypothetical protein